MSQAFERHVQSGSPVGTVQLAQRFIVEVVDLPNASVGAVVMTRTEQLGLVRSVSESVVVVDMLTTENITVGEEVVVMATELTIRPNQSLLGRIVDPLLRVLDDKAPILSDHEQPVFAPAPAFNERALLNRQLETGVTIVDTLFPIVLGQRIAIMGDAKSGKTSFAAQLSVNQARLGRIAIFVLIAKRKTDVEQLVEYLKSHKVMNNCIIVVADSLAALPLNFLAPYCGCAIGEYFWQQGRDVIMIYDDLANHAKVYREMALLGDVAPGRESYPGDMFYRHSSLLERAGKLARNEATLTALPIMTTANNDITSHLSTSLISITDGQLVFDTEELQRGSEPPISVGLSVSRVGGRAQESLQKNLAQDIFRSLAAYRQASEFARFGQELPDQYRNALLLGDRVRTFFNQSQNEFFSLPEQQIMLKAAFLASEREIDMQAIKKEVKQTVDSALASQTHEDLAQKLVDKHGGKS